MDYFNNKCLLCLAQHKNIKNVLSEDDDGIVIGTKFYYVLTEENITSCYNKIVNYKPHGPKYICTDCLRDLNHVYNFKQKCLANLKSLCEYIDCIGEITSENIHTKASTNKLDFYEEEKIKIEPQDDQDNPYNFKDQVHKNILEEVVVKGEPANTLEIIVEEDPLLSVEDTKYVLQNDASNTDYISASINKDTTNRCSIQKLKQSNQLIHQNTHTSEKSTNCTAYETSIPHETISLTNKPARHRYKSFPCDQCAKTFAQKSHLIEHKRIHTGEKPYSCEFCDKAFAQKNQVIKHKRVHTGEKPYSCEVCDRAFSQPSHLSEHKRTHTGEKPYECEECDKAFSQRGNLIKHKRTHIGNK